MSDVATDCDRCGADIPYGVTCYSVPTGRTWDVDDGDLGKPIVQIVCAGCYTGPAKASDPIKATYLKQQLPWVCPNDPPCGHGAILHDVFDAEDQSPTCCVGDCPCGRTA